MRYRGIGGASRRAHARVRGRYGEHCAWPRRQHAHRLAAGRRPERVAGRRGRREQRVRGAAIRAGPSTSTISSGATTCRSSTQRSPANDTPDVIEMGNTEMTKYMAEGAFANLGADKSQFANSSNWLGGLRRPRHTTTSCTGFRTTRARASSPTGAICSRRLASRSSRRAWRSSRPISSRSGRWRRRSRASPRCMSAARTGTRRSASSSTTADRSPSTSNGKWVGTLDSKNSIKGLTAFQQFFDATQPKSTATLDGTSPFPYTVFSQGKTAANYGPAWYTLLHRARATRR